MLTLRPPFVCVAKAWPGHDPLHTFCFTNPEVEQQGGYSKVLSSEGTAKVAAAPCHFCLQTGGNSLDSSGEF